MCFYDMFRTDENDLPYVGELSNPKVTVKGKELTRVTTETSIIGNRESIRSASDTLVN